MIKKHKMAIAAIVVLAIAAVLSYDYLSSGGNQNLVALDNQPVSVSSYLQLQSIAMNSTLAEAVGQGIAAQNPYELPKVVNSSPIIAQGKPTIVFIGADYCPYCAVARWSFIIALMRFGNFTTLHYMTSSSTDVFPITPTFTFYNSTYSSSYVSLDSTEIETNTEQQLQTPDSVSNSTFYAYDTTGGVPFFDFDNKSVQTGPSVSPSIINNAHHWNWNQIMSQLSQPNSTVSQAIIGAANIYTAEICYIDGYAPSTVCNQPYVSSILSENGQ